ncbi:2599_t:CDS:2 [Funneliformis caledonium]|uniref:2599_t:CDS:1 n=1 Tax=Funneliformis caledonium TaxID=1117310 RepID=A0A9N9CPF4_9GLOM|nr:2599_t:CDS:2 [Funneliformis caledonium]
MLRFRSVDDSTKLEELTVHSYNTRLKEKWDARSMKDVVLIDLQENNLHSLNILFKFWLMVTLITNLVIQTIDSSACIASHSYKTVLMNMLECLHRFEEEQQAEVKDLENNILCNDDDKSEPIEYVAYALEEALHKFQQQ